MRKGQVVDDGNAATFASALSSGTKRRRGASPNVTRRAMQALRAAPFVDG